MVWMYCNKLFIGIVALFISLIASPLKAQTPPIDLTELSVEELLNVRIISDITYKSWADRWSVGYRYDRMEFGEYLDGTRNLSTSEVLTMFAVMPEKIVQEIHMTRITYNAFEKLNINLRVPYIRQRTTRVSRVPGYGRFTIHSSGIGDISLNSSYRFKLKGKHHFMPSLGISFPVGSIDEKGDTPSPGLRNQLPYTMQIGSGTFDPLLGIDYTGSTGRITWGGGLHGKIHLGRNYQDYSLGDRLLLDQSCSMNGLSPHLISWPIFPVL